MNVSRVLASVPNSCRVAKAPMLVLAALLLGAAAVLAGGCGRGDATARSGGSASAARTDVFGGSTSRTIPPGQRLRGDGDADNPSDIDGNGDRDPTSPSGNDGDADGPTRASLRLPDTDDRATFAFGRDPSAADRRALVRMIERYYAAAAKGDGQTACALMLPSFARSLPEDYGGAGAPTYLRGRTCPAVLSARFRHFHSELAEAVTVVAVRVSGKMAQVVLSSRSMPASSLTLQRAGGQWRVAEVLGQSLP